MSNMAFLDKFSQDCINDLMAMNTTMATAEAIAIAVAHLKDKEGKMLRVSLSDSHEENMGFFVQIAKQLRNEK